MLGVLPQAPIMTTYSKIRDKLGSRDCLCKHIHSLYKLNVLAISPRDLYSFNNRLAGNIRCRGFCGASLMI